jgi:hypothetical protein
MKAIISDSLAYQVHAEKIKNEISRGYGSDISSQILIRYDTYNSDFQYCVDNNIPVFVRSYAGLGQALDDYVLQYYFNLTLFYPLGSNLNVELTNLNSLGVIIASGAGENQNVTAYGNGLEFWDTEEEDTGWQSSYSNGRIAGKILKIIDVLSCNAWEARYRARMTASNNGVWDKFNGYGKINVQSAIDYSGEIISNPYIYTPPPPSPPSPPEPPSQPPNPPSIPVIYYNYYGDNVQIFEDSGYSSDGHYRRKI